MKAYENISNYQNNDIPNERKEEKGWAYQWRTQTQNNLTFEPQTHLAIQGVNESYSRYYNTVTAVHE